MAVVNGDVIKAVATHELWDNVISQSVWYYIADFESERTNTEVLTAVRNQINDFYEQIKSYIKLDTALSSVVVNHWDWDLVSKWLTGPLIGIDTLTDYFEGTGDGLPHAAALTMTGFTEDVNTRSRKSIGGIIETASLDSDVIGACVTAMAGAMVQWLESFVVTVGNDLLPIVPSKTGVAEYLLYGLVSDLVGSQRQRKPGIGV